MNLKKRLEHIAHLLVKDRRMGQTTMIAKAAAETGGMVIARTHEQAKEIERKFQIKSMSMEVNLEGHAGPFYLDHYAASGLLTSAATKIEKLEKEKKILIDALKMELGELKAEHILEVKRIK